MPPKKKEGGKKKAGKRPPWMTEEMFALSQNLPKLTEFWSGEIKETKGKPGDKPPPNITRTEAGLFILQLIFPSNKAGKEKREECIKMGIVETSVKVLASQKPPDMVSAAHLLAVMADTFDQSRQVMIDSKPAVIPQLLTALASQDSAPLRAAVCGLLKVIASHDDVRPRLWRQVKEWDWGHLIRCLKLQELSQLGGRNAAHDAMSVMESMVNAPEGDVANQSCNLIVAAGGIQAIVDVLKDRVSHPMARACGVAVLNQIMRRAPAEVCEEVVITSGGLQPIIGLMALPIVPLKYKAHAAAVLLRYIMPDALWKNASMLPGGVRPGTATVSTSGAAAAATLAGLTGTSPEPGSSARPSASAIPARTSAAELPGRMDALKLEVMKGLEPAGGAAAAAGGGGQEQQGILDHQAVPDDHFLDDATKEDINKRSTVVAQAGAVRSLVQLCIGPDGPLPDLEAAAAAGEAPPEDEGKKKKKKKAKKKKGKLEPGMGESQTWASAVLRMISLAPEHREGITKVGGVRYLLPLLDSKVHAARWNARQTLINLSISPQLVPHMKLYKVPDYIHGSNIPQRHFERPFQSTGILDDDLCKIPKDLEKTHKELQTMRAQSANTGAGGMNKLGTLNRTARGPITSGSPFVDAGATKPAPGALQIPSS